MTHAMRGWRLSGYGAWELKRSYRHNLMLGILIASALHGGVFGAVMFYRLLMAIEIPLGSERVIEIKSVLNPPPSIESRAKFIKTESFSAPPVIGVPVPFPDEQVTEEVHFATKQDILDLQIPDLSGLSDDLAGVFDSIIVDDPGDYFPEPGEFVAFQEPPRCVHAEPAVYPEIALLTGRVGSVTVLALVDKDGNVQKVRVGKPSGANVGFDEAAMDAVAKYHFRPAIQNGRPVAVWISQRIDFKLD